MMWQSLPNPVIAELPVFSKSGNYILSFILFHALYSMSFLHAFSLFGLDFFGLPQLFGILNFFFSFLFYLLPFLFYSFYFHCSHIFFYSIIFDSVQAEQQKRTASNPKLITTGFYSLTRHPMYLLTFAAFIVSFLIILIILFVDLSIIYL